MEKHLLKAKIQFIYFFFYFLISNPYCKDIHEENIYNNIYEKQIIQEDKQNKIMNYNFTPGNAYHLNLYKLKETNITFFNISNEENYVVHFYPLECKIFLTDSNGNEDNIYRISNYNYDAFYALISQNYSFIIKPLIYSLNEEIRNITCPLVINSVKISNNNEPPELVVNEKEPILFYFNDKITNLILIYNHEINNNPIIVSFFIKEKARFRIENIDGEEEINKIIYYKETILIQPKSSNSQYKIKITRIEPIDTIMIIKISGNNNSAFYLQNNVLNLGFIPKKENCQYYYMKIYKGQEGEILLNNKRLNGMLISKIINKSETYNSSDIDKFPKCNKNIKLPEYLQFDEYNKKLCFNSSQTKDCGDNCYLLVTYYSEQHNDLNITGNEYTLLTRIWDEDDFISQIVNIPLNEFIFGFIDNSTINVHYYSVYIPEDIENITIEIHGENIISYAKKGIKKINAFITTSKTKQLNKKFKGNIIININSHELGLQSYKGQYISFAFKKEEDNDQFSYYYFRIFQTKNNKNIIHPLDANKESLCQTEIINGSNECYFLLKNEYKELYNKFVFYGFGQDEIFSTIYCVNISDEYPIELEKLELKQNNERQFGYLKYEGGCENSNSAMIKIISNHSEIISFISNFYLINKLEQIFDIYSYQLFYLETNQITNFDINQTQSNKYRVFINNIGGRGYLKSNDTNENKDNLKLEGRKNTYSFSFNNENQISNISFFSKVNLAFLTKVNYQLTYDFMDELDCQYNKLDIVNKVNNNKFPIIYYIKDNKYEGMDINLHFKFQNESINNDKFRIQGGFIDYYDFKDIEDKSDVNSYLRYPFNGLYAPIIDTGLLVFDKELSDYIKKNEKSRKHDDLYSFILIDKFINNNISEFTLEINIIPKNDNKTFLIENKYAQSSFNLTNKKSDGQKYYIDKATVNNNTFYLELSSNYNNTYIEFNDKTQKYSEKKYGGVMQYYLSISSNETDDYSFSVKVNYNGTIKDPRFRVNINLIYYLEERKFDVENFIDKFYLTKAYEDNEDGVKKKIKIIIKNYYFQEINASNLTYFYYLGYINQKDKIENETLNTIAPVYSNMEYLNEIKTKYINQELVYEFECDIEQDYLVSLFIKIVNDFENEKNEKYYSIPFYFNAKKEIDKSNILIIIISFIAVLFIILMISFLFYVKIKNKNKNLEDKIKAISFSSEIEDDLSNKCQSGKSEENEEYENAFI